MPPKVKHTTGILILTVNVRKRCRITDSRSKKQEIVGLVTPKVVVTHLSSFLSSMLLCGGGRMRWESKLKLIQGQEKATFKIYKKIIIKALKAQKCVHLSIMSINYMGQMMRCPHTCGY